MLGGGRDGKRTLSYGSWNSPITAEIAARQSVRFGDLMVNGDILYWVESRPVERGRSVIVQHTPDNETRDVLQFPFNARSRVHEYGGGAFAVSKGNILFVNFEDQRIYERDIAGSIHPVTAQGENRYADLIVDELRSRIICIQENHAGKDIVNRIVSVNITSVQEPSVLVSGNDFYSSPRMSPDNRFLIWLTWNHPNMPWDGTELWIAEINDIGTLSNPHKVAGGIGESIFQPEWSPDGILYFVSDRNGWWNIYRYIAGKIDAVTELDAEFGVPQWNFGLSTYAFTGINRLVCIFNQKGICHLASVDTKTRKIKIMETAYTDMSHIKTIGDRAVFYGGSPTEGLSVVMYNLSNGATDIVRRSVESPFETGYLSSPELIEFDTTGGLKAYGFFYRPQNMKYVGPETERPPLIVVTHGGPTACSHPSLDLKIQFWTTRGFAVFDINYGGSTGFGRPYRERLKGEWGVVDVDDCVNGAIYLVNRGLVDGEKLIIRGGSAGGYTTLAALTFRDLFKAGASYYGVSDLEALAKETHKFESRYLDSLIGVYPETARIYRERSPINYPECLSAAVIFFQGLDDKVVPPDQAEKMVRALRAKKIPVAYVAFEGEQHGFRKADNLKRSLEAEFYFYSRVLSFELTENIAPVAIDNI
jgi:dipeptidyl aminopeptidase/acylaminoacyl peptidase